jgi:pimeloyl-ACP methyl ester carboxylesterase
MRGLAVLAFTALLSAAFIGISRAEEVSVEYLGLELSANLESTGKSKSENVVLLVHDTLGHAHMESMAALQDSLHDLGLNSLAITLSLGMNKRHGMFDCALEQDHRHEDAVEEISVWVQWLKEKGATSITLAGHGRGANQVALYAINRGDKAVKRAVLISPLMQTEEKAEGQYRARFGRPLRQELAKAEEHVANEEGNHLLNVPGFLNCQRPVVTAGAFANYYGANAKFETTNLVPSIKIPVLIAVGDGDPKLAEIQAGEREWAGQKNVSFAILPGTDQDLRDLGADELAKKIKDFIGHKLQG